MALVESNMMALGTTAPSFSLPDTVSGKKISLHSLHSEIATVIVFICNHCPYVHHINNKLVEVANTYQAKGVQFIAISSNDIKNRPEDNPEQMKKVAETQGYNFPYLYDESQEVAKAYRAECTPDFFVFNKELKCVYRGRFDESTPGRGTATGKDLASALNQMIAGLPVNQNQYPSMGCSIKWK